MSLAVEIACSVTWLAFALEGVHRIQRWWCAAATFVTAFPAVVVINFLLEIAGLT